MAKAKIGHKRQQQQQQQSSNTIKNKKHKSTLPESSPNITHEQDSIIQDNEENDLFANLDEEMDSDKLDDIVQQLEASSSSSSSSSSSDDDDDDDNDNESDEEAMSEDEQQSQEEEEEERIKKPTMKPKFRDHYMGQITRAFGSDLDKIRQEPTFSVSQLPILINSLESGIDIFSNLEQEIILADAIQE
ncbi:hypothetical protein INT45_004079 [Circinella minor]|uniref:Ribosome assembly protein 3 n=1 Tax=Circinella minor TaxID=1195481 RepID=A0A8H7RUP1_9FUNG|nr:hypothetical protein INT45_004079 [Circinella minor]